MSERPIWRGSLRLALVSCPVALYSVREAKEALHFHFINPATGHRVRMITQDAETEEELSRRDLVRGYEFERDRYVLLEDEDFERARIDSSSTMAIDKFVDRDAIDPIYYDSSYYMAPDGGERDRQDDVFVVLRDAITRTGRVALSRVVISRRERAVAIMPMERGLVLHTLHDMREITNPASLFEGLAGRDADPAMIQLATQLIDRQTEPFRPEDMEDRYEKRLREVIEAKLKGVEMETAPEPEREDNVIDLMAALRRSLGESPRQGGAAGKGSTSQRSGSKAVGSKAAGSKGATAGKAAPVKPAPRKPASGKSGPGKAGGSKAAKAGPARAKRSA